jgi:hypothetical protein
VRWLCDLRRHCGVTQKPCGAALVADHSGRICLAQRRGQRPLIPSGATPTDGWHGPACTQPCWAWSHSAIAVGAGQPARSRNPRLRWRDRLLSVGPPHRTDAIGARSTIDEVRDRLRIMVGLTKIRAPGAQTGRSVALEIKISACPVSGGWVPIAMAHTEIAQSRNRRRFRRRTTFTAPRAPSIVCIAERDIAARFARAPVAATRLGSHRPAAPLPGEPAHSRPTSHSRRDERPAAGPGKARRRRRPARRPRSRARRGLWAACGRNGRKSRLC